MAHWSSRSIAEKVCLDMLHQDLNFTGWLHILEQSLVAMLQPWALISTSSCTGSIMSMVSQSICDMHISCHVHVHVDVMFAMYTCHVCMSDPTWANLWYSLGWNQKNNIHAISCTCWNMSKNMSTMYEHVKDHVKHVGPCKRTCRTCKRTCKTCK